MTVSDALKSSHLPSADAEILLSHVLRQDRAWLLAHAKDELSAEQWTRFMQFVERRRRFEPVQYITGEQEFYGRKFFVDKRVLIPRPATEGLVTRALQFLRDGQDARDDVDEGIVVIAKNSHLRKILKSDYSAPPTWISPSTVVDIGTGSGAIAITLALERPDLRIIATDISASALEVAKINAERHGVASRMTFKEGSGLDPVQELAEPFLLVSNPPYIPSGNDLMKDVKDFEPHVALFGGSTGMEITQNLIRQAEERSQCIGYVMEGMSISQ